MNLLIVLPILAYLCGAVFAVIWVATSLRECWEACKQIGAKDKVPSLLVLPLLVAMTIVLWPLLVYGIFRVQKQSNV